MSARDAVLFLDLLGTFAFALNGALTAARTIRVDIVGILVLGLMTAVGGGMTRDVLIGAIPPAAFTHWYYLVAAAIGSIIIFFVKAPGTAIMRAILVLDAIGLSLFAVVGAGKAVEFGLNPVPAILVGVITAVGGGTIRDVMIGEVPAILTRDLYAIPALLGASIAVLLPSDESVGISAALLGALSCFAVRMLGLRFHINAPRARIRAEE